jgi:hypothetical protein
VVIQFRYKNDARRQQVAGAMTPECERLAAEIKALEEHMRLHHGTQSYRDVAQFAKPVASA